MAQASLKRYAPWAAVLGLAGLIVAGGVYLVQRQFDTAVQASLAVGLLGLALALLLDPASVQVWLSGRQARYGGNALIMVLALLGILVLVNFLAVRNPQRWDWSEDQVNTLAPETLAVVRQLDQPVRAIGFYSSQFASSRTTAEQLLERYRVESGDKLTYEFHDPIAEPFLAQEYGIQRDGTLVIEMGEAREEISFASETEVTGALLRLQNPTQRVLYYTTGHGEVDVSATDESGLSVVADMLRKQNYELQPINLQISTTVPGDAKAVVIAGPRVPFTAEEVEALRAYANGGGSLVVMLDPLVETQQDPTSGAAAADPLVEYLGSDWGVTLPNDVVVDLNNSAQGSPFWPLNAGYGPSPITRDLGNIFSIFVVARSVVTPGPEAANPDIVYTPVVPADSRAWGETNFTSVLEGNFAQDEADTPPGFNLAVSAENTKTKARLVVFGDSAFATNAVADRSAGNLLLANSLNWVTLEENLINLTPKVPTTRSMAIMNALTVNLVVLFAVVVLPAVVLILGGTVWFQRRRHA